MGRHNKSSIWALWGAGTPVGVTRGAKRSAVGYEKVGITLPDGIYEEMVAIIETDRRWFDRVEFVREAVKEKIERWKKEHPLWSAPAKDRPGRA